MNLGVEQVDTRSPVQRQAWQEYVGRAAHATLFHTLSWHDAICSNYAHRPHYLMAYRDSVPAGVFPLFEVRSIFAGRMLVSLPYAVYGGVVADDKSVADALLHHALVLAERLEAVYIDIRSFHAAHSALPRLERYATFIRGLPDAPGDVVSGFPRKARAEIRRARDRFGLDVRFDDALLPAVWDLYSRSMRRLGSLNFPYQFFQSLVAFTPEHHLVCAVFEKDRPIAGLLSFMYRDTVLPYYIGTAERAKNTGANNLIYATLMEKAVALGLRRFDFGRTRIDNAGSFAFKKNQGFEPTILGYQYFVPPGRNPPNLTPNNKKFIFARKMWRRMPLALTRPLGAWFSASIPG